MAPDCEADGQGPRAAAALIRSLRYASAWPAQTVPRHHDRIAALLLLGLSTGSLIVGVPSAARAQLRGVDTRLELGGRRLAVSPLEMRALLELGSLVHSGNRSRQDLALAVARSAARTGDARFALATYELEIGKMRGDDQMRVRALTTLTASDLLPPDRLTSHLNLLGQLSFASGDLAGARGAWERILRRSPDRHETLAALAQVDLKEAKWHPAIDKLNRAIDLAAGSGTKAPESWYQLQSIRTEPYGWDVPPKDCNAYLAALRGEEGPWRVIWLASSTLR